MKLIHAERSVITCVLSMRLPMPGESHWHLDWLAVDTQTLRVPLHVACKMGTMAHLPPVKMASVNV